MLKFEDIASFYPGWVALAFALILGFNKLAEESEKFANFFGKAGRKIRDRALKKHGYDIVAAQVAEAVQKAVEAARREWEEDENEAITALDQRLGAVSAVTAQQRLDLEEMRFSYNCCLAYADYETQWHSRLTVKVGTAGSVTLEDLPRHYSYYDFEKQFKKHTNWRKWAFDDE